MVLMEKFIAKNNCMSFFNLSVSVVFLVSEKLHYCYNDMISTNKLIELWTQALPVPSPFASPWSQPFCGWSMDLGINSCLSQWVYRLIDDFSWSLLGLMTSTCIVFCFSGPCSNAGSWVHWCLMDHNCWHKAEDCLVWDSVTKLFHAHS